MNENGSISSISWVLGAESTVTTTVRADWVFIKQRGVSSASLFLDMYHSHDSWVKWVSHSDMG